MFMSIANNLKWVSPKKTMKALVALIFLMCLNTLAFSQAKIVAKGHVTNEKNEPVFGASVLVKGTTNGASTDEKGDFSISATSGNTLVISFVGYQSKEIVASSGNLVDVKLAPVNNDLEQVVVIGYGSVRKKDVTGSVASISGAKMNEVPAVDISRALQGRVAGVEMSQTTTKPGSGMQIRIRGIRSLNASNDPLIVLDGIPFSGSLTDIDPNDVKSTEILKDASATAIYGSRGANGVILVTTNKGQVGQKARFTYNSYAGVKNVFGQYPMMDGTTYALMRKTAAANGTIYNNTIDEKDTTNTNWQDLLYRQGYVTNQNVGVSGGSEKGNYNVSFGYFKDQAVIPMNWFERYSLRTSLEQKIGSLLKIGFTTNTNFATTHDNNLGPGSALNLTPILSPYKADGTMKTRASINTSGAQWLYTRSALEALGDQYIDQNKALSSYNSIYTEVKIPWIDGLKYRANVGLNYRQSNYGSYTGQGVFSGTPTTVSGANTSNNISTNWAIENLLTYDRVFAKKHRLSLVGMYSAQQTTSWYSSMSGQDIPADAFQFYNIGRANVTPTVNPANQSYSQSGLLSYMGRAMYSYNDKYYLTATFRSDASSVLAPGHQWHSYPAISGAWNIKEDVLKNVSLINALKVRAGYGETSNQAINPYQTLGLLSTTPYNFGTTTSTGMYVTQLPNPVLGWEFSKNWNFGLDFTVLNNRLSGTIEYYTQNTSNVLLSLGLPTTSGVSSVMSNIGTTQNKGIELSLNGTIIDNHNGWTWEAGVNFYHNQNKLTSLASGQMKDEGNQWFVGHGVDVIFDYKRIGLWSSAADSAANYQNILEPGTKVGLIKVQYTGTYDANGKPTRQIGADDRQVTDIQPDFEGGFNSRVTYKSFDFSFTGSFRSGGILISTLYGSAGYLNNLNSRGPGNVNVDFWQKDGDNTFAPRPGGAGGDNPKYGSTMGYFSASYLKVRTISFGYNFTQKWMKSAGIEKLRFYCTLENPFVFFSPYKDQSGMDPETNSHATENTAVSAGPYRVLTVGTNTPSTRNYLIGLNLTF